MNYSHQFETERGLKLHYDIYGDGEPLLLLSGGPGAAPGYLAPIANVISQSRQCIVLHQRGTGRSVVDSPNKENINVSLSIDDVEALRLHLDLPHIAILGHSWGGMLAMAYAASHPGRVSSLILVCSGAMTAASHTYLTDNITAYLTQDQRLAIERWESLYLSGETNARFEHYKIVASVLVFNRSKSTESGNILLSINLKTESLILESIARDGFDVSAAMSRFEGAVTLINARQDYIGEGIPYETHATVRQSKLIWIERSGHFPWLDNPEPFFQAIRQAMSFAHETARDS